MLSIQETSIRQEYIRPQDAEIWVIDDEPDFPVIAGANLEPIGCRVSIFANGREALRQLRARNKPSRNGNSERLVVLLDCYMPDYNGPEFARDLDQAVADGKIITKPTVAVFSTEEPDKVRGEFEGLEIAGIFDKSIYFSPDSLAHVLTEILNPNLQGVPIAV